MPAVITPTPPSGNAPPADSRNEFDHIVLLERLPASCATRAGNADEVCITVIQSESWCNCCDREIRYSSAYIPCQPAARHSGRSILASIRQSRRRYRADFTSLRVGNSGLYRSLRGPESNRRNHAAQMLHPRLSVSPGNHPLNEIADEMIQPANRIETRRARFELHSPLASWLTMMTRMRKITSITMHET